MRSGTPRIHRTAFSPTPARRLLHPSVQATLAISGLKLAAGIGLITTYKVVRTLGLPACFVGMAVDTFLGPEEDGDYVDRTSPADAPPGPR
jgi:hypothetical protein